MIKLTHVKSFLERSWLRLLAIVMLLVAVNAYFSAWYTLPYAFYQLMCWVVVLESLMIAWQTYKDKNCLIMWISIFMAIVFNPITPIYMTTFIWQIANLVVVFLFILSFFFLQEKNK